MASLPSTEIEYERDHIHESQQAACYGITIVFFVLAVVSGCLRLLSRRRQRASYGLDDYLAVGGVIAVIPFIAATLGEIRNGIGKHLLALTPEELTMQAKWEVVNLYSYTTCITLVKLSILALVHRVFGSTSRQIGVSVTFLATWVCLWAIALYFAYGFQCQPFWRNWSLTDPCGPSIQLEYSASILNAVHDSLVFILPQPTIWKLHLPIKRKLGLSIIFSIGFVATLMGILKILYVRGAPGSKHKLDSTYTVVPALIFNAMEPLLAIICSCLSVTAIMFQEFHLTAASVVDSLFYRSGGRSSRSLSSQQSSRNADDSSLGGIYARQELQVNSIQEDAGNIPLTDWKVGPQAVGRGLV